MLPLFFWASFMLFVNVARAGGYAGALERLWLYYAYEIDQLKPKAEQTLGFGCLKKGGLASGWDSRTRTCPIGGSHDIQWRSCGEVMSVDKCNFNQLMIFLGGVQKGQKLVGGGAEQTTRTPPIEETAANFYNYRRKQPGKGGRDGSVGNYAPESFLKESNGEYNAFIKTVGDKVVASSSFRNGNEEVFDGFEKASEKVTEARIGDHGRYLIAEAEKQSWAQSGDIQIKTEPVGNGQSPVKDSEDGKSSRPWVTINMEETLKNSKLGREEAYLRFEPWLEHFYTTDGEANRHRQVMTGFNDLVLRVRSC